MQTRKKRILMCTEASFTKSGYGVYTHELLSRLYSTNKYEIAEFASYSLVNDSRDANVKWRLYSNAVSANDPRYKEYKENPLNQLGAWRFERVLLDFKPDIVFDIRDPFIYSYQFDSPLREYFHWAIMPTVDSAPQKEEWIEYFLDADGVLVYSDWAIKVLNEQSNGKIKTFRSAPHGVLNNFHPLDKVAHKKTLRLDTDINIIGTVMRNQSRKLYPDLMQSFKLFLDKCEKHGNRELANKTFLYFHTSYPEKQGWNFPALLKEYGLGSKVYFTYYCKNCETPSVSFFQDAVTVCGHCLTTNARLPSTAYGLKTEDMNSVYNLFDVYVQYSVCEGFGMPQVEAAACGVPVMSVDYSAMADIVRNVKGFPLKVERMYLDKNIGAYRALPDNQFLADKLYDFFTQSEDYRQACGQKARKGVEINYNWDNTAKTWENYFDGVKLENKQGQWDLPAHFLKTPSNIPDKLTNSQFVEWCYTYILNKPHLAQSRSGLKKISALNLNQESRENMLEQFLNQAQVLNIMEELRCGIRPLAREDYIEYAHFKEKCNT